MSTRDLKTRPADIPRPGEVYQHYKGGLYAIESISVHADFGDYYINYRSCDPAKSETLFTRHWDNWNCPPEDAMGNHTVGPRFSRIKKAPPADLGHLDSQSPDFVKQCLDRALGYSGRDHFALAIAVLVEAVNHVAYGKTKNIMPSSTDTGL